jgi:hypothetical protein
MISTFYVLTLPSLLMASNVMKKTSCHGARRMYAGVNLHRERGEAIVAVLRWGR